VDLIEADIGTGARIVLDLHVTADNADSGVAGSRVVLAVEIAADLDAGAVESALVPALPDLDVAAHSHRAFEKREVALIGLDVAGDRRWILPRLYDKAATLPHLHVTVDLCALIRATNSAGGIVLHGDAVVDDPNQGL